MSCLILDPSNYRIPDVACGWCSLRLGPHKIHNTPTCAECRDGGRAFRVRMGVERLRRAAGKEK
jgi:hypothetical protein